MPRSYHFSADAKEKQTYGGGILAHPLEPSTSPLEAGWSIRIALDSPELQCGSAAMLRER